MHLPGQQPERANPAAGPIQIYLGLYILLLAFFVLLNTLAQYDEVRTRRTLDSVSATFAADRVGDPVNLPFVSAVGNAPGAEPFTGRISRLVATTLPLAQVEVRSHGQALQVTIKTDAFFIADEAVLKPEAAQFLDKLATALAAASERQSYRVQFLVGTDPISSDALAAGEPLAVTRAGHLARNLARRGMAADAILTGIEPSGTARLHLLLTPILTPWPEASPGAAGEQVGRGAP